MRRLLCLLMVLWAVPASAATYYVAKTGNDSNAGTLAAPYLTIRKGIQQATTPGDTVYVRVGTYDECGIDADYTSGTSGHVTTISAYPNEVVWLVPTCGTPLGFNNKSYITFSGMNVDGVHLGGQNPGYYIGPGDHYITIQNATIKNVANYDGIAVFCGQAAGDHFTLSNLDVFNNGNMTAGIGVSQQHGIYVTDGCATGVIEKSRVYGNAGSGIQIYGVGNGRNDNWTVQTNVLHDNYQNPNWGGSYVIIGSGDNQLIANNVVYQGTCYGTTCAGITVGYNTPNNTQIYHNTVYGFTGAAGSYIGLWAFQGTNALIKNNISYNNVINYQDNATGTVTATNLLTNPTFVNAGTHDFHLQSGSAAKDTGTTLGTITEDSVLVARPKGSAYDIGAFEYDSAGTSYVVHQGEADTLQTVFNGLTCGDTVTLDAGGFYSRGAANQKFYLFDPGPQCDDTTGWIAIRTADYANAAFTRGRRLVPGSDYPHMARLYSYATSGGATSVVICRAGANHYHLIGLELVPVNTGVFTEDVVTCGSEGVSIDSSPTYADLRTTGWLWLDHVFIHPNEITATDLANPVSTRTAGHGFIADGSTNTIEDSYIAGFAGYAPSGDGISSFGVAIINGPGPVMIKNDYIEAEYNNVFLGGGGSPTQYGGTLSGGATTTTGVVSNTTGLSVGMLVSFLVPSYTNPVNGRTGNLYKVARVTNIAGTTLTYAAEGPTGLDVSPTTPGEVAWAGDLPHDITVRDSLIAKQAYFLNFRQPKGFIELKSGQDILIDHNVFDGGAWGTLIGISARNQSGRTPWDTLYRVTFTNNRTTFMDAAVKCQLVDNEYTNQRGNTVTIRNDLFFDQDPDSSSPHNHGIVFDTSNCDTMSVTHTTFIGRTYTTSAVFGYDSSNGVDATSHTFVFKDNILQYGGYGFNSAISPGTIASAWPSATISKNIFVNWAGVSTDSAHYGATDVVVAGYSALGFVDLTNKDYRLAATSPYYRAGSDGNDIGVYDWVSIAEGVGGVSPSTGTLPVRLRVH